LIGWAKIRRNIKDMGGGPNFVGLRLRMSASAPDSS
jgi:hypothetical protein